MNSQNLNSAETRAVDDPLFGSTSLFPLGAPFGKVAVSAESASLVRPFGLRFAVVPDAAIPIDTAVISYDPVQQIGIIRDGEEWVPLARHTDGKTKTKTSDCEGGLDNDEDVRED